MILGGDFSCTTWPSGTGTTCDLKGELWKDENKLWSVTIPDLSNYANTEKCESLCAQHASGDGCCQFGLVYGADHESGDWALGCWWKEGAETMSGSAQAVTCTKPGEF